MFTKKILPMQKIEEIIVVRHGSEDGPGWLAKEGIGQILKLASVLLKLRINLNQTKILSSSVLRAVESSQILSWELGVPFVEYDELEEPISCTTLDTEKACGVILKQECSVLIVVTHFGFTIDVPKYIGKKFGFDPSLLRNHESLDNGECLVISLAEKTFKRLNKEKS